MVVTSDFSETTLPFLVDNDNKQEMRLYVTYNTASSKRITRKEIYLIIYVYYRSFPQKMDSRPQISSNVGQIHIQEQTYIQAPSYMQTQNYSTPATSPIYARTSPNGSGYVVPQALHKKGSLRNGDILKRSRIQNT